jgi:excisionase family DNA binding protein
MTMSALQHTHTLRSRDDTAPLEASYHTLSVDHGLVNAFTLAKHFSVHCRTVQRWTRRRLIPYYRVGKSIRYNILEVMDALSNHVQ